MGKRLTPEQIEQLAKETVIRMIDTTLDEGEGSYLFHQAKRNLDNLNDLEKALRRLSRDLKAQWGLGKVQR